MFKIENLSLYSTKDEKYEYVFKEGLNYFSGANNTGKTVFYGFMDYMFGSSDDISNKYWFRGTLLKAEMQFEYNGIKYRAVRTIDGKVNYFGYTTDEVLEQMPLEIYKDKLMSVFTPDEEILKELRNFIEEDITYRTFTMFNFLGENRQGYLNNFFDKCDKIQYSIKLMPILNFIFNNNLERINELKKDLKRLNDEIKLADEKKQKSEYICRNVNEKLSMLEIDQTYSGYNANDIKIELAHIKSMQKVEKPKQKNIADLETVYNNISEQIKVYKNIESDMKQFDKQNKNQKILLEKLEKIVKENDNYIYLVNPIIKLTEELDQSISFSKYLQKDETITVLESQLENIKKAIKENESRFRCYSVDEKTRIISLIEDYLDVDIQFDYEELERKLAQIKEIKKEIKYLQNADDIAKINNMGELITDLYSFAEINSEVVQNDLSKMGFRIKYFKNGNVIQPIIKNDNDEVNYYTGSEARHTLMQLSGYLAFLKIMLEDNKYPLIPFLVIDHISKPFDEANCLGLGKIFEKAYELIGKENLQIFIFDDKESGALGITPDYEESLKNDEKTGFNPFFHS